MTTTLTYNWTWQWGAHRLTDYASTSGVTTTFDYDALGRIARRYTAQGYSDYIYEGNTDWLSREKWHSTISNAEFNLLKYWYTNGRPSRVEVASAAPDLSSVSSYTPYYIQYNWHGDAVAFAPLTGGYAGTYDPHGIYDPWGNPSLWPPNSLSTWNYYRWAGAWGYMKFDDLGLYYVHGRWYNPETALWLSPDGNGDYLYSGDRQDAVNQAQVDSCKNHQPPLVPPVGGITVDWIKESQNPNNTFPVGEIETITRLKADIFGCAARHNTAKTNMDDNAFAALITAILHIEGKLEGNGKIPADQQRDRDNDFGATFGFNGSSGVAKISQSVAVQILRGEIPGMSGKYCYTIQGGYPEAGLFAQMFGTACDSRRCWDARFIPVASELAHVNLSLEYLAANLERGADRINALGEQASVFNLATWHNRGVQTANEIQNAGDARNYGNVALSLMPTAFRVLGVQGRYFPYTAEEEKLNLIDPQLLRPR